MSYAAYNITIPNGKTTGEIQVLCPQCSHTRQKKNDKCLSVNLSKGTWFCQHCGWKGGLPTDKPFAPKEKEYVRPVWHNRTTLSDKVAQWFEGRGIRQEVLKADERNRRP
jgi:twinkle protein